MAEPPPAAIGYLAKRTWRPADRALGVVEEVCSVSCCISPGPPDAIAQWRHNTMGLYASEALALAVIPETEDRAAYDLYAYFVLPAAFGGDGGKRAFDDTERTALAAAGVGLAPLPPDYVCLGWDVVSNSLGWVHSQWFECSPLTCNGMARAIAANRFGLIDDFDQALAHAGEIARGQPEPGNYYVVQVWRKGRPKSS